MSSKSPIVSKTLWANVIAILVVVFGPEHAALDLNAEQQTQVVGVVLALVNIVLRFVTRVPILK